MEKEFGDIMSEQAKNTVLQEGIRREQNNARLMYAFSVVGFIPFVAFFGLYFILNQGLATLAVGVIGLLGAVSGVYGNAAANRRKTELMEELDKSGSSVQT
jgi:hypothetical protein